MDDMIRVNPAAVVDYAHGVNTYSSQLDDIQSQAENILGGIIEYFNTEDASLSYSDAQRLINEGIQEGRDVMLRHGAAVDNAQVNWVSQDATSASTFRGI
jgi:uncharacterized protein YukE